jgi:hypothetical protein
MNKIFFILIILWGKSNAQESINSTSGLAIGSGGTVAFTLGQICYKELNTPSGSISEGIQHAYEIYPLSSNNFVEAAKLKPFPNPTIGLLNIELNSLNEYQFRIVDVNGIPIINGILSSGANWVDLEKFNPGIYIIEVLNQQSSKQIFKVVKN